LYLEEHKKCFGGTYGGQEGYGIRKNFYKLVSLPFDLLFHALRKKKMESEPGPGTFCWKGKHYNIEEYIQLCAQEIYAEGYDLEYLHKLLDDIIDIPGHDLNEYRIEALKKVIARTEADLAEQEKQEEE
jgi:hypothetical protein